MEAEIIKNSISIASHGKLDNEFFLELDYDGTYEGYKASPVALLFQGKKYARTGHNSDTFKITYKTNKYSATSIDKVLKDSLEVMKEWEKIAARDGLGTQKLSKVRAELERVLS
jgi:hypothetical protein